jgi:hypothetical protein
MAERSVFIARDEYPFFEEVRVQFDYFQGFALSQKRKSQIGLHQNFSRTYPENKVLEVSSASLYSLGSELSAMNLKKQTRNGITSVESAFQSSRIYGPSGEIGPFPELLFTPGKECKKIVKERSQGLRSRRYRFEDLEFHAPAHFISLFYNYLYLNALCEQENQAVARQLISSGYTAFTDLATTSLNCQARSCAIFVCLVRNGLIHLVRDYDTYLSLFRTTREGAPMGSESFANVQLLDSKGSITLRSPVVPCVIGKEAVASWYEQNCGQLTNRKTPDNFLDMAL